MAYGTNLNREMAEKIVSDSDTAAYDRFIESAERGESDA